MNSASSSTERRSHGSVGRSAGTLLGVAAPFVVALLVWIVAAPRAELISVGDGRGLRLPDSGANGGTQVLMMIILLAAAVVCVVLVLWHLHPHLRRPRGVLALVLLPGLSCAVAAAAATPLAGVLAAPPRDASYGQVVLQAPAVGELFTGRMIYGVSGPSWDWLPPGTGWLLFGAMIAAFTVAALAHFSPSRDLSGTPDSAVTAESPPADAGSRTGR